MHPCLIRVTHIFATKAAAKRDRAQAIRRGEQVTPVVPDGTGWAYTIRNATRQG